MDTTRLSSGLGWLDQWWTLEPSWVNKILFSGKNKTNQKKKTSKKKKNTGEGKVCLQSHMEKH